MRVVSRERDAQIISGQPQQLTFEAEVVLLVDVFSGGDVVDRAVAMRVRRAEAERELVINERARNGSLALHEIVIAVSRFGARFRGEAWLARSHVDCTGR